jgi:hypothetical protein
MHPNIYIDIHVCVCVCVLQRYIYIHDPFLCMSENWPALCVRVPLCDGDGSAVCACVGGLVLRARPKTRNPKPCEPLPVGVDRVRLRRAGVRICVGVQRQHRRVEHRGRHHAVLCMRRSRRRRRALRRPRLAGLRCGAAGCARRHRRCARALRTRAGTRLRGAVGVGTDARRGGSVHVSEYMYRYIL